MTREIISLEGLVSGDELASVYRKRNRKYVYKRIVKQDLSPFINEGWEKIVSKSKKYFRLRKLKDIGPGFEDEVWCIFNRMGFQEMNTDNTFTIPRYGSNLTKQIDVFAKDDQCIVLVECKAAEKPHSKKSLGQNIDHLSAIRYELQNSVVSHYKNKGIAKKIKLVWILALKNIDISDNDKERAEKARIHIFDNSQIEYYIELSKHLGNSAKYQFLAEVFSNLPIPELVAPVPAIRGKMGKTTFYSFVMEPDALLKICYIAHREKDDKESLDTYQRIATKRRLKKIAEYIQNKEKEGIFPTSIVINIETKKSLKFDCATKMAGKNAVLGTLHLPNKYKTAWIIDGQHRLFAYSGLEEAKTATLPVVAFENLDPSRQAQMFVDINGEQVKVKKTLLIDLWANMHWNSKDPTEQLMALTSRFVKKCDTDPSSPLRDRIIKIGGRRTQQRNITMTSISDELRKRRLLGSVTSRKANIITPGPLSMDDMKTTLKRAEDIIFRYLKRYKEYSTNLDEQWELGSAEGGYICTNMGMMALLRVLAYILEHLEKTDNLELRKCSSSDLSDKIWKYQEPVCRLLDSASPEVLRDYKRQTGDAGIRYNTFSMIAEINESYPHFDPPGLQDHLLSIDTKNTPRAQELIRTLEVSIMKYVTKGLKDEFGDELQQWFNEGVPRRIRDIVVPSATSEGEYVYYEKFVDLIHWKDIISQNFGLFGDTFTIDAKATDTKKKKLRWFEELNKIRRICAHGVRGNVTDSQLEYLKHIHSELMPKLVENQL